MDEKTIIPVTDVEWIFSVMNYQYFNTPPIVYLDRNTLHSEHVETFNIESFKE